MIIQSRIFFIELTGNLFKSQRYLIGIFLAAHISGLQFKPEISFEVVTEDRLGRYSTKVTFDIQCASGHIFNTIEEAEKAGLLGGQTGKPQEWAFSFLEQKFKLQVLDFLGGPVVMNSPWD